MQRITRIALIAAILYFIVPAGAIAQRVGFISSETIRDKYPEAQAAEQRVQSMVEEWKRELSAMQSQIDALEFEIKKNRLIWSDKEREKKQRELEQKKTDKMAYARAKFEPGGEYDATVKMIMRPIEAKIYATVQKVAADEGFDIVLDQSVQPMPYVNFKYDLTVKVLRELGVDVEKLQEELKKKIEEDPRNKRRKSRRPRSKSRARRINPEEQQKPDSDRQFERGGPEEKQEEPQMSPEEKKIKEMKEEENKVSPFVK
jgi:outer membrane protein